MSREAVRELGYGIAFIAICCVLFGRFFFTTGDIISHGDVNAFYGRDHRLHDLTKYLFNDYGSLSNMENYNTALFLKPILFVLRVLGLDSHVNVYKAGTLLFLILSYMSATVFLKWLLQERSGMTGGNLRAAEFLAAVFYTLSPYVLNVYPAGGFWLAYALTPLFIVYVYRVLCEPFAAKNVVVLSLTVSFMVVGTQYLFFSAVIAAAIFVVEATARARSWRTSKSFFTSLPGKLGALGGLSLLLNLHWILPTIVVYRAGKSINPGYVVTRDMIGQLGARANLFTTAISADSWAQVNDHRYALLRTYSPGATVLRYALVVASLAGLLLVGKGISRRIYGTLLAVFLLFWSFSIGLHNPFYEWLALESPVKFVGWIFRSPSKLTYILWLVYAVGFTLLVERVLDAIRRPWRVMVAPVVIVFVLLPSINKLYSVFNFFFVPTELPSQYRELYSYLDEVDHDGRFKVAFLAPYYYGFGRNDMRFEASFTWDPHKMIGQVVEQSSPVPSVGYWHMTYRNWQATLFRLIYPEFTSADPNASIPNDIGSTYLAPANVRYLVFHNDIVGATTQGADAVERLRGTDLRFVKQFGDDIFVFENPAAQPPLWVDPGAGDVQFTKVDPTRYRFTASLTDTHALIHFAQSYDPFWEMHVNGHVIEPKKDGTIELTAFDPGAQHVTGEIEYLPQSAYATGGRLSNLALTLSLVFLGLTAIVRPLRNKRSPRVRGDSLGEPLSQDLETGEGDPSARTPALEGARD